jgi:transposase
MGMVRRQVTEIPPVKAEITGHQLIERECGGCGARTKGKAPEGVTAPVQYGPRAAALGSYLWHGQFLSRDRARAAMADMFGCAPSAGALAALTNKIAGLIGPALDAIIKALLDAEVAHFDETGFRVAGKLAWVHSASSGRHVLVTVHAKRGRQGMDAAGVLSSFAGIACHDAWAPYDGYGGVAGHALCCAQYAEPGIMRNGAGPGVRAACRGGDRSGAGCGKFRIITGSRGRQGRGRAGDTARASCWAGSSARVPFLSAGGLRGGRPGPFAGPRAQP